MLVQPAAHRTGLLGPQVEGLIFLSLVELPEVLLLGLVNDGQQDMPNRKLTQL